MLEQHFIKIILSVVVPLYLLAANCSAQNNTFLFNKTFIDSMSSDLSHLPSDVIEGSKLTVSKPENIAILAIAGGASIAMNQGADDNAEGYFERHEIFHNFTDRSLKSLGNPGFHFAATGFWYALAVHNDDPLGKQRSWTMIKALSVTGLATVALKGIRNDETPVGNDFAWPSGHTSSSFAVASVLDEFYGPEVGIPAYTLASLVGLRMADQGDHWASDVVFGAALGWVIGHTIAAEDKKIEIAGFHLTPYTAYRNQSVVGVNLIKRF